jgi:hypothetical protein
MPLCVSVLAIWDLQSAPFGTGLYDLRHTHSPSRREAQRDTVGLPAKKSSRQVVLVELGRIAVQFGNATAATMADRLAKLVDEGGLTTTRQAEACLRRARLELSGRASETSAEALVRAPDHHDDRRLPQRAS